jgi:hypothetical protein
MGRRRYFNLAENGGLYLPSGSVKPLYNHPERRDFFARVVDVTSHCMKTGDGFLKIKEMIWYVENRSKYYVLFYCEDNKYRVGIFETSRYDQYHGCSVVKCTFDALKVMSKIELFDDDSLVKVFRLYDYETNFGFSFLSDGSLENGKLVFESTGREGDIFTHSVDGVSKQNGLSNQKSECTLFGQKIKVEKIEWYTIGKNKIRILLFSSERDFFSFETEIDTSLKITIKSYMHCYDKRSLDAKPSVNAVECRCKEALSARNESSPPSAQSAPSAPSAKEVGSDGFYSTLNAKESAKESANVSDRKTNGFEEQILSDLEDLLQKTKKTPLSDDDMKRAKQLLKLKATIDFLESRNALKLNQFARKLAIEKKNK